MGERTFDLVIVGAGLSGIGAACRFKRRFPDKTFVILESRGAIGGTWDLYRYPGIRSDSDMHTLGYDFKPWIHEKSIADGPAIRDYVNAAADEYDVRDHVRFHHRVDALSWSSEDGAWTLDVTRTNESRSPRHVRGRFVLMCSGYYDYDEPYRPPFPGEEDFEGPFFHPQLWPESLDYSGKRVVVIGSGATAVTLVPAMTDRAAHVTMLQRSPTWVISMPARDRIANALRKLLPSMLAYRVTRFKNVTMQKFLYRSARRRPEKVKRFLSKRARRVMGDAVVEKHFTPRYDPWDQRLCLIPDADLFEAIKAGKASVVTDHIERVTKTGIRLKSGDHLDADVIIAATGLNLKLLGGASISVDGEPASARDTFTYKGIMYSGLPNLVNTFGYINASWTLRADLIAEFTCRLLERMDEKGVRQVTPTLRESDRDMPKRDWIENFSAGYLQRVIHTLPKQGDRAPWLNTQDYAREKKMILEEPLEDDVLVFSNPPATRATASIEERIRESA